MNVRNFLSVVASGTLLFAGAVNTWASGPAKPSARQPATTQPTAASIFSVLDSNKDKVLSLEEFQAGYVGMQRAISFEIALHEQFRRVDTDHNGRIDAAEYAGLALVKRAGKAAPALSTFDANDNQTLEFDEYIAVVRKLTASQPGAEPVKK